MHYYKLNGTVYAFDDEQLDYVTKDMVKMTDDEIDKHINPQNYLTNEQKRDIYLASIPPLTKRQFTLYLYDAGMYDTVLQAINADQRFKIEFESVTKIERTSDTTLSMSKLLNLTDAQVDDMWQQALTY